MKKVKQVFFGLVCCMVIPLIGYAQSSSFKTYSNPVIPGDHSDCTLTKIGNDFYTTGSSFNPTPIIYHSTDLIHWEAIAQPVSAEWSIYDDKPQGGCWGGQIVFYNNKYWDFFSRANIMYFVTADKPEGPWSMPTKMKDPSQLSYGLGYDNSIFIDDDGKWYLMVKNGQANGAIVELGNDGQATGKVYDLNWLNPSPAFPYSWAEGPVMWKHNGYYYYSFARDVSGGQKVMRSKTLTADQAAWTTPVDLFNENDPGKSKALFSGPNHSSAAVLISENTSWVLHPVWARANNNEWYGQGRQGLINQVRYNGDEVVADYPANKYFTAPNLPSSGISWMVPKSDFFNSEKLHPEWSFLGYTPGNLWSLSARPGWLRLSPKSATKSNTVIKTDAEHNYSLITRLEFSPLTANDEAGIRLMNGKENLFVKLYSSINALNRNVVGFSFDKTVYEADNNFGNTLWLKMERVNHIMTGFYSVDGNNWIQVGKEINIANLDNYTIDYNGWCGNRQGLYAQGKSADFDLYIYRDAYTSILGECPANYFGTVRSKLSNTMNVLDSIHNNDWALYAGVEFGSKEYPKASDSVQFLVSSVAEGAMVEVWLDSIDTGSKIATCTIGNTGSLSAFKTFSAKTIQTIGKHDVYLRFKGTSSGKLLILQNFKFTSKLNPKVKYSAAVNDSTIQLKLTRPVSKPLDSNGFAVLINNEIADSAKSVMLSPNDSSLLILTLNRKINITDLILVSYKNGGVKSSDGLELESINALPTDNLLYGSVPQLKFIQTNKTGDSIYIKFSKAMNAPDAFLNKFIVTVNNSNENTLKSINLKTNDSVFFCLTLKTNVYYEDDVKLTYSGTEVKSTDNGLLKAFSSLPVTNTAAGYAPEVKSVIIKKTGSNQNIIVIKFSKALMDVSTQRAFFSLTKNGNPVSITTIAGGADTIQLKFTPYIVEGDVVKLSYSGGSVSTMYNGFLADFKDYVVREGTTSVEKSEVKTTNKAIQLFPNPASGALKIKSQFLFHTIKVFNTESRLVYSVSEKESANFASLNLNLPKGIYLLQLSGSNSSQSTKLLIE